MTTFIYLFFTFLLLSKNHLKLMDHDRCVVAQTSYFLVGTAWEDPLMALGFSIEAQFYPRPPLQGHLKPLFARLCSPDSLELFFFFFFNTHPAVSHLWYIILSSHKNYPAFVFLINDYLSFTRHSISDSSSGKLPFGLSIPQAVGDVSRAPHTGSCLTCLLSDLSPLGCSRDCDP